MFVESVSSRLHRSGKHRTCPGVGGGGVESYSSFLKFNYRPQTKLRKGNVFTFTERGGVHPLRQTPPPGRPPSKTATAVDGMHSTGMHFLLSTNEVAER